MMRQQVLRVGALVFFYSLLSLSFSLLAINQLSLRVPSRDLGGGELLHLGTHLAAGILVAAPSRRWDLMVASGLMALGLDIDHLGEMSGIASVGRASHAFAFFGIAAAALYAMARLGLLVRGWPPLLVAAVTLASGFSHIAVDAWPQMASAPLWMPLDESPVRMSRSFTAPMMGLGMLLVLGASFLTRSRSHRERSRAVLRPGR